MQSTPNSNASALTVHSNPEPAQTDLPVKTKVKVGGLDLANHNQSAAQAVGSLNHPQLPTAPRTVGVKVKSRVKTGGIFLNHNETLVRVSVQ